MTVGAALRAFAGAVAAKASLPAAGEAEEQLRAPFEALMAAAGAALGHDVACVGEARLPDRMGKPDFAIHRGGLLAGYAELKAPGAGADARRFKGRNRRQFERFSGVPNMLYGDGNEWALYRGGERAGAVVRLAGDIVADGARATTEADAAAFARLLQDFLLWEPVPPLDRRGRIDLAGFAAMLAPLCRMLRDDVKDALADPASPLVVLAKDWRKLLFPEADDAQFADSYAQTVTFALLLGRGEGADPFTLDAAQTALAAHHGLLSRALQILTDPQASSELTVSLDLLLRTISAVPTAAFSGADDPWLYFYEDFLAAYDSGLRRGVGVYYTPVEVVRAQVRLIDALLAERLGKPLGFADPGVVTLDPAAGTGTYLLGVIEHALGRVEDEQGPGAVAGAATELARNLYGFEFLVGPYAVCDLRIGRALADRGAALPPGGARIYLTHTLESHRAEPPELPLFLRPIAEQRARALDVKSAARVLVCLGNPPYGRHEAVRADNRERTGSWVRHGGHGAEPPVMEDFLAPVRAAGHGVRAKNIYNYYIYFWRWALWKVFEHETAAGPGVVSFITASSWLDGDAFLGMRAHMRRLCDEIWILDLGGEGRGPRKTENVFAIQTPVAIAIAVRAGAQMETPARVRYAALEGTRDDKLAALDAIEGFSSVKWRDCPTGWRAPFRPAGAGPYFGWPSLADLMPWQHTGAQLKRTWPIGSDEDVLRRRWRALLSARDRTEAFKETRDRSIASTPRPLLATADAAAPIAALDRGAPAPRIERYAYRSFDRQWVFADTRLGDYLRPDLWRAHGDRQLYLTSLLTGAIGDGPALAACALVPDLDHFRGSYGAKAVIPLYRDPGAAEANIAPGLLDTLGRAYGRRVAPEDFLAYVYGALAHPAFTARFAGELASRQLRVPLTRDSALFEAVRKAGARLLRLHTYGERLVPESVRPGAVPRGEARCTEAVPADPERYPESFRYDRASRTLRVGAGAFAPVQPEIFDFQVSGLKVVRSWLRYRMKAGAGRRSSPLDRIRPERWTARYTTEFLELLWVLEATVALYPEQARLLESIVAGPCFASADLPQPDDAMRRPPKPRARAEILR